MNQAEPNLQAFVDNKSYYITMLINNYGMTIQNARDCVDETICQMVLRKTPDEKLIRPYRLAAVKFTAIQFMDNKYNRTFQAWSTFTHIHTTDEVNEEITFKDIRPLIYQAQDKIKIVLLLRFRFRLSTKEIARISNAKFSITQWRIEQGYKLLRKLIQDEQRH